MIKKVVSGRNEYFESADGRKFPHITRGMAWPHSGKPGFHLVMIENFNKDFHLGARLMTVIKEAETRDVADLVRRCQDWQAECQVQVGFGNTENRPMMATHYQLTQDQLSPRRFSLYRASHAGDPQGLGYYLPVIKEHLRPSRRILHFMAGSNLPGYLGQVGAEAISQDPAEYPPIAALGYALTYLFENNPEDDEEDEYQPQCRLIGCNEITGY